ncbi:phosphoribosylanthranilate isomerase [Clostridium pascui]|uniref:phosphoribosylanthranilate isomerase n=1 Tax=Clostridium pascui TaxID=46609 RepID=UPI00195A85D5|nr:phosphoribosylanthranilate isomerase [Clostridium pascui]MBM7870256.1 phosphoribosylanthranilate isomerase [Clostridium pascui]
MIEIKVCGLKREEDIKYVNELKPDYVGFVFAKSSREITLEQGINLVKKLDKNIKAVGVFVDKKLSEVEKIASTLKLDVLQFHGKEDNEYMSCFKSFEVWKALGVTSKEDLKEINKYKVDGILLDSKVLGRIGGTGESFNWDIISNFKINKKLILAGGLNSDNVKEGISKVNPNIVDVSSGIEVDGFKDFDKIKEFIEKVRETV